MKKKIIILSCHGGGGHISAASAIKSYLEHTYTVVVKDALGEILAPIDPTYYLSFKQKTGQDIYNFLLRHNQKKLTNLLYQIGNIVIQRKRETIQKIFLRYFQQEKPDLIISVIPIINGPISQATQQLAIPYLLVPTDLDITTFITGLNLPASLGTTLCLGFDYPEIKTPINADCIHHDTIMVTGFPLGPHFFEKKNIKNIKKQFTIIDLKPVIVVMMGAVGSCATISYIRALSQIKIPFHLIACTGRNTTLQKKIRSIVLPDHIGISIIDTSHDISDVMAIADLCITKSGSVSFAEVLYMNVPIFLDKTTTPLLWEALNFTFLKQHNLGEVITNFNQVSDLVTSYLANPSQLAIMKKNSKNLQKKHFGTHICTLVDQKLKKQQSMYHQRTIHELES